MKNKCNAKILVLDIETAPAKVYSWGLYDQNIGLNQVIQDSYMLSWAAKWYHQKRVLSDSLIEYRTKFKADPTDDSTIARSIWKLLDEADIVIAHNGDNFDLRWLNTVFLRHGMKPPSSFKSVDTLKETRGNFYNISNKLDYLCKKLSIGHKLKHEGFELWPKCMEGNVNAWKRMVRYNEKDVLLLQELYNILKPYMKNHPNLALYSTSEDTICPVCGGTEFRNKGYAYTSVNKYKRYVCKNCGKNIRSRKGELNKKDNIRNPKG